MARLVRAAADRNPPTSDGGECQTTICSNMAAKVLIQRAMFKGIPYAIYFESGDAAAIRMSDILILLPCTLADSTIVETNFRAALKTVYGQEVNIEIVRLPPESLAAGDEVLRYLCCKARYAVIVLDSRFGSLWCQHQSHKFDSAPGVIFKQFSPEDLKWRDLQSAVLILSACKNSGQLPRQIPKG